MISSGFERSDWSVRTARRLSEQLGETGVLGTRLAYLLTRSGPDTSSGTTPTAHGVRSTSAWCSRSVHVVHVVADQELSDCTVPRYRNWYEDLLYQLRMREPLDSTFNPVNYPFTLFSV